jgi:hypothetical protein
MSATRLAQGLILRHRDDAQFRAVMQRLAPESEPAQAGPFEQGLYGASEMLIEAFLALIDAGILRREVDGVVLHGAFFVGPKSLYRALREMLARIAKDAGKLPKQHEIPRAGQCGAD